MTSAAVAPGQREEMDCEDFLELVWGERKGWVDIPAKVGQYWVPFHLEWTGEAGAVVSRRIDTCLRDREDLYYSVAQYSRRGRAIEDVMASDWLWADLDEVHPSDAAALGYMPTVAVESSPGRYQALWKLTGRLAPSALEKLNRGLSYALEADRGGWDLTQVLRIPGTRNFKYADSPLVRLMWYRKELVYDPRSVWASVRKAIPADTAGGASVSLPRTAIPAKAKALLRATSDSVVEGERSARLWELECLLAESGLDSDSIFELVRGSAWNKWRGSGDSGRRRLRGDIAKALAHVRRRKAVGNDVSDGRVGASRSEGAVDRGRGGGADSGAVSEVREVDDTDSDTGSSAGDIQQAGLPWVGYSSFMAMAMEEPKWLIEDIWTAGSHGIIGGEPKTSKTTVALALALAVASGSPFLGRYAVGVTGPVLMVQEENAPWMMQDRLRKMAAHSGLISTSSAHVRPGSAGGLGTSVVDLEFPVDLPLKLLNNYGFDLGVEEHRDMLEAEVEGLRPKLLILDPLYLILPADQNSADDLRPFLKWLLALRYEYDCAVAIVHHFRKAPAGGGSVVRAGQRILGSTILHGFSDSALYLTANESSRTGWLSVTMETEFRSMAPQSPIALGLSMGPPGSLDMSVEIGSWNLEGLIRDMVTDSPGITANALAASLGVDKRTVLARVRGGELGMRIESGAKGRGRSHQIYLANTNGKEPND